METLFRVLRRGSLCIALIAAPALANPTADESKIGQGIAALGGLLSGGSNSLASKIMSNAAGVLQYCIRNNLIDNKVSSVRQQVMEKLGFAETEKKTDYKQGVLGLLQTGNKPIDLNKLGETPLGKKAKTKACDVVLNQTTKFLF
ncbi:MAG: hypothetical protein XXXJIFNMEKO3_00107 [Candidatus Erwinia impunctatus]|nr:hypothetical protein XXXJIFNMEKO_00107 [Culicoides impunctatus]